MPRECRRVARTERGGVEIDEANSKSFRPPNDVCQVHFHVPYFVSREVVGCRAGENDGGEAPNHRRGRLECVGGDGAAGPVCREPAE